MWAVQGGTKARPSIHKSDRPSSADAAGVRKADGEQAAVRGVGNIHKLLGGWRGKTDAHTSVSSRQWMSNGSFQKKEVILELWFIIFPLSRSFMIDPVPPIIQLSTQPILFSQSSIYLYLMNSI